MSLPSGASPWNSIFGPGRRSKYYIQTGQQQKKKKKKKGKPDPSYSYPATATPTLRLGYVVRLLGLMAYQLLMVI